MIHPLFSLGHLEDTKDRDQGPAPLRLDTHHQNPLQSILIREMTTWIAFLTITILLPAPTTTYLATARRKRTGQDICPHITGMSTKDGILFKDWALQHHIASMTTTSTAMDMLWHATIQRTCAATFDPIIELSLHPAALVIIFILFRIHHSAFT